MSTAQLSTTAMYGVTALAHLGDSGAPPVSNGRICAATGMPARFLLQIMRKLVAAGLATSIRGAAGGYALARPRSEITLLDVVEATDGPLQVEGVDADALAAESRQRLREAFEGVATDSRRRLKAISLATLGKQAPIGKRRLKIVTRDR